MLENINNIYQKLADLYKHISTLQDQISQVNEQITSISKGGMFQLEQTKKLRKKIDAHEAYSSLFFNFLLIDQESRGRFARFLELLGTLRADEGAHDLAAMQSAARVLIEGGALTRPLWTEQTPGTEGTAPPPAGKPPVEVLHHLGDNIIRFPTSPDTAPEDDQD